VFRQGVYSALVPPRFRVLHPALFFVVAAWGLNFSMVKVTYLGFATALPVAHAPAAVTLLRYLGMWPIFAIAAWYESRWRIPRRQIGRVLLAQFVASGVYMILFMEGMRLAGPGPAAVMLGFAPLSTILLSLVLRMEKFSWSLLGGTLLATAGVVMVGLAAQTDSHSDPLGILLLFISALTWGLSVVMSKPILGEVKPFTMLAVGMPAALLLVTPYAWTAMGEVNWVAIAPNGWLGLAYLILVAGVAAFWAYYRGLSDVGPAQTGLVQYLIPPVAAISGFLMLGQAMTPLEWVGMAVVIAGLAWARRETTTVPPPETLVPEEVSLTHEHVDADDDQEDGERLSHDVRV
jgi:probable blue pigment (indigoidine) exporter